MRVRMRLPKVFVGHPFRQRFPVRKFRKFFKDLPFSVVYANSDIETKHLLQILKKNIKDADYSLFDLSGWNPNVTLELGLAEGLGKKAIKKYFILLNTRRGSEAPADVRGIQRLEYSRYDYSPEKGLGDCLITILRRENWVKKIVTELQKQISEAIKYDNCLLISLRIIAHMRDYDKITNDNLKTIIRGTRLRRDVVDKVLCILQDMSFIKKGRGRGVYHRKKKFFG